MTLRDIVSADSLNALETLRRRLIEKECDCGTPAGYHTRDCVILNRSWI